MTKRLHILFGAAAALAVSLGGCGADRITDAFSGGSSMRIDVEVYKGPLSKRVSIQWGELAALVKEASGALASFDDELLRLASIQGYLYEANVPEDRFDSWGGNDKVFAEVSSRIDDVYDTMRQVANGLSKRNDYLATAIAALGDARGDRDHVRFVVGQLEKIIRSNGDGFDAALHSLKVELGKMLDNASISAGAYSKFNPLQLPDDQLNGATMETVQSWNKLTTEAKNELTSAIHDVQYLLGLSIADLGKDLRAKLALDLYGDLTIQPHNRGQSKNRQDLPSRAVERVRGVKVDSSKNRLLWCKHPDYREALSGKTEGSSLGLVGRDCLILAQIHDDIDHLLRVIREFSRSIKTTNKFFSASLDRKTVGKLEEWLGWASEIGTRFKTKSFFWAETQMIAPSDRVVRTMASAFANMASELGNQIASRADTILQQCPKSNSNGDRVCDDYLAGTLPLSVYLREINPTEFHNLFTYNRSGGLPSTEETFLRPAWELGTEESADRARVVEALFADHNWSNINTVYASGQGDVSMAFVKDAIGNWNLKSFKNDPTDLLEGYKQVSIAAIKAAAKMAEAGATGGASSTLDAARRMFEGRANPGAKAAGIDLTALSDGIKRQLENSAASQKKLETTPPTGKTAADARKDAKDKLKAILENYDGLLQSLQSAVVNSTGTDPAGTAKQLQGVLGQ